MMDNGKRIAILFHKNDRHHNLDRYSIVQLAKVWQEAGHEVVHIFGPDKFVAADLALVHVNLSVVPESYIRLARRYPIVLNAGITDIRKRTISEGLLQKGDGWAGAAIVKSDLNYAGYPERNLGQSRMMRDHRTMRRVRRLLDRLRKRTPAFTDSTQYRVYDSPGDVPVAYFEREDLVVEKFRPELEGGLYHTRFYLFLGDSGLHRRLSSRQPVVNRTTHVDAQDLEPDERILAWRKRLGMDYGKLDYVIVDGEVVLLDVNKTIGTGRLADDEHARRNWRFLAEGLYPYLDGGVAPL